MSGCTFCHQIWNNTKRYWVEIIIFIIVMGVWLITWAGVKPHRFSDEQRTSSHFISYNERALALNAMQNAITGTLMATSIILAAFAAALGLYKERSQLPTESKQNFKAAACFGLASILFAVLNLAYIPAQVNTVNIASVWLNNLLAILQLSFMFFSAYRLMKAIRTLF